MPVKGLRTSTYARATLADLRWWQVVLHCLAGGIACIVVLVNLFLIIPACRRRVHHAEENMSYFGAFFMAIAGALHIVTVELCESPLQVRLLYRYCVLAV